MRRFALLFLFSCFYLYPRYQNFPGVVTPQGIVINDTDPYYRLHRMYKMLKGSLTYPLHDPMISPPLGFDVPWPLGLDILLVAPLKFLHAHEKKTLELFSAFAIPLLSLPTLWAIERVGTLMFSGWVGWGAVFLLSMSPAHIAASSLGRIDHHFLEAMFTIFALYFLVLTRRTQPMKGWVGLSFLLALSPSFWPQAWVLSFFLAGSFLLDPSKEVKQKAVHLFLVSSIGTLFTLMLSDRFYLGSINLFGFSWWTPLVYSLWSLLFVFLNLEIQKRWKPKPQEIFIFIYVFFVTGFLFFKNGHNFFASQFHQGTAALIPEGGTMATTLETFCTLLLPIGRWPGMGIIPLVLSWFWLTAQAFRKENWWWVGFGFSPLVLAAIQVRFFPMASPVMILGSLFLIQQIVHRIKSPKLRNSIFCASVIALSWPSNPGIELTNQGNGHVFYNAVIEAAQFLKSKTPGPIIAHWDYGHWLLYYTGFPVVAGPFQGSSASQVNELFVSEKEDSLEEFNKQYDAKYLIVEKPTLRIREWLTITGHNPTDYMEIVRDDKGHLLGLHPKPRFIQMLTPRFYVRFGRNENGEFPDHWRVIYVPKTEINGKEPFVGVKIFEQVKGAKVVLHTKVPNLQVVVNIETTDGKFQFLSKSKKLNDSTVKFDIPYSLYDDGGVKSDGKVYLLKGDQTKWIATVQDQDVEEGRTLNADPFE